MEPREEPAATISRATPGNGSGDVSPGTGASGTRLDWSPLWIALEYAILGILWIVWSDAAVLAVVRDQEALTRLQTYKGWFYVLASAALLFFLVRRRVNALNAALTAQAAANRVVEVEPTSSEGYRLLGDSYAARGEKALAEAMWKQSLRLNERNEGTLVSLADLAAGNGAFAEALSYLKTAVEVNPADADRLAPLAAH